MKNKALVLLLFCMNSLSTFAQNTYSIKGSVADTTSKTRLVNATITVLNSKDSIFYKFSRTAADAAFNITDMAAGSYILLVSYHGYADYTQQFTLDSINNALDFGRVNLILKSKLLAEVVIKSAAITIKGDTTVFNASSYKVQPNAKVEDLLKQLPGLQVDQRGKITAYGQEVRKVLVDGEEFFSSDPTLVTRNIRADMVSRVELVDKKSDKAEFTGVDDGQRTKTVNVVLKDNSKNGYFGKVEGAETPDLRVYNAQAMLNSFSPLTKISAFITAGNTNRIGLSYQDNFKLGVPIERFNSDGTPIEPPKGLLNSRNGGFHYDTKWNENKEVINLNYTTKYLGADLLQTILKENNLPGGAIHGNENLNRDSKNSAQRFEGTYTGNYNPNTIFKINVIGSINNNSSLSRYLTTNKSTNNLLLNRSNRTLTNAGEQKALYITSNLQKKLKKAGRSISFTFEQTLNNDNSTGYLYSASDFYNTSGLSDSTTIIDQYKPVVYNAYSLSGTVSYSEPVNKSTSFNVWYGVTNNNILNNRESFNKSTSGKYDIRDNVFSNNIETNLLTNQIAPAISYRKNKTSLNFGVSAYTTNQRQTDLNTGKEYNRDYINMNFYSSYSYRISQQKTFSLNGSGFTEQPNIDQIQPVRVNTDPLYIVIGNTGLKPYLSNSFSASFSSVKPLTGSSSRLAISYSARYSAIVNKTFTDAVGKTVVQYVNLNDKTPMSYTIVFNTSNKLKRSDVSVNGELRTSGYFSYNYINGELNKNQRYQFNFTAGALKTKVNKYDFNLRGGPTYTLNSSSLQPKLQNNGLGITGQNTFNVYLPGKAQFGTVANYTYNQGSKAFNYDDEVSIFTVDAAISKKFLKKENLVFSFSGNDLLNQNLDYTRNTSVSNIFSQTTNNVITRYLMFSLTWDFIRKGKVISAPATPQN